MKRWTVERCERVGNIYSNKFTARDRWIADCWRTMGAWLKTHPELTDAEAGAVWDFICERKEGRYHKVG